MSGVGRELVIESASQATEASSMKESRARCTTHTHTERERERERGEASNLCSILVENEEKGRQRGMNDDQ